MATYHSHHAPVPARQAHAYRQGMHDQVIGLVMFAASAALWIFPMATHDGAKDAQVNEAVIGAILMFVVGLRIYRGSTWRSDAIVGLAGLWMIASPYVLGLQNAAVDNGSRVLDIAVGAVLVVTSLISLLIMRADRRARGADAAP
ncbi:SPW repeat domain-containing protein [Streptomyces virginiae]|uniref:SPW repeat domain-containing protein n=1 Tax=Streptomyces virginiae TaxID=1961 RepID=UPI00344A1D24